MQPEAYDFWLLDLDGTIVDTEWAYTREVFDAVGEQLGYAFSDREARALWHGLLGSRDAYLEELGFEPVEFWETFHAVEDPQERAEATYLHEDAAFVADLDVPVGVVTHSQPFLADPVMANLDIADWFDTVVTCSSELGWKPDPTPLQVAMDDLGVDPQSARGVMAGDADTDVGAAWNAGLDAIHVERHGACERGKCVLGDYRVADFSELFSRSASD
ncbi:HAD family hydrolase [Halodesulfurarchaeum formicicum]|uniref:HAD family hydrolase n=1 Tax=Halodesulfurarchaeum formicicum TaxID=1873524 RepID=UPI000903ABDD|nr:HAD family hydrolase [Halodesulfurarchaeum formicicum]